MVRFSDPAIHAVSGAAGGCVAMAITYPLVCLSTRAQVKAQNNSDESFRSAAIKVLKEEGISGLYDGLASSLVGIAITNGIYYLFFEETRALLLKTRTRKGAFTTLESIVMSAIAGAATSILSNPIWVVNTRQTVRGSGGVVEKKLNIWETVKDILKTDGPIAFWHGLGPALLLVSNPILQYTLFEQLKNIIAARRKKNQTPGALLTDLDFFLLGAVSKLFATAITYPYLTVKARMQAGNAEGRTYSSSFDGVSKILKSEGPQGLYRGVGPKLTQSVATAAILFLAKEKIYQTTVKTLSVIA